MLNELLCFMRIFVTPSCWIRNERTDKHWDRRIRKELENPTFTDFTGRTVRLNGAKIWIANHPYASVTNHDRGIGGMPSRRTVFMFDDALRRSLAET